MEEFEVFVDAHYAVSLRAKSRREAEREAERLVSAARLTDPFLGEPSLSITAVSAEEYE